MSWNLEEASSDYQGQGAPREQGALISLLKEIQQEQGSISRGDLSRICEGYGIKEGLLLVLIKRIPSLRLADTHCLELCSGPNCSRRTGLASFVEKTYGTNPGKFTVKFVPCMRMCGKGPNIKWDGKLHHQADEALLRRLIEEDR